jgi:imidazole glycerol-phosphate synthase subunit HisH
LKLLQTEQIKTEGLTEPDSEESAKTAIVLAQYYSAIVYLHPYKSMLRIAIVDYDSGNLHSVCKGLQYVGAEPIVTDSPAVIAAADAVVLPGVGSFDPAMRHLQERKLIEPLRRIAVSGQPFLGICLGLQLLFEGSAEGKEEGLGVVAGRVERFRSTPGLTIPHMGWNQLELTQPHCALWQNLAPGAWMYFVHSFYVQPTDAQMTAATITHGDRRVPVAIAQNNLQAVQFHPEKSATAGLQILANFLQTVQLPVM